MELQDKPLDPQESLQLIQQFIAGTRSNIRRSAFGFIFWGILIAVAALLNYFMIKLNSSIGSSLVWPVLSIAGLIVTVFYYAKHTRRQKAVSSFGRFFSYLFICGGVTYLLLIFLTVSSGISSTPFMLALASLLITVVGLTVRFRPFFWGGFLFFATSIASVFVSPENQLLLLSGSFLFGYLLPGIILVRKGEESC